MLQYRNSIFLIRIFYGILITITLTIDPEFRSITLKSMYLYFLLICYVKYKTFMNLGYNMLYLLLLTRITFLFSSKARQSYDHYVKNRNYCAN